MPLRFTLRAPSNIPLEVEGITPDATRGKSLAEVERMEVFEGNVTARLADFFRVTGDSSDDRHVWEGDLAGVHWLGAKMSGGTVTMEGNAGRHLGSEMRGGEIHVLGNVSDWVGAEMHGGLIHVRGSAGDAVGAAYRGSARGMTKGAILVGGDAGNEIGSSMRRGLIAVRGKVGDLVGINMLAGTIVVFGEAGIRPGAGMKRGTIALLGKTAPPLLPTFRHACRYRPEALQLIYRHLRQLQFDVSEEQWNCTCDSYNGDFVAGGRGELLIAV